MHHARNRRLRGQRGHDRGQLVAHRKRLYGYARHQAAGWSDVRLGDRIEFDLLVNEMQPERLRRAGQLVWSGGGGWVWLRGDRQDPSRFGTLELR